MSDIYAVIAKGMAKALWVSTWADWADAQHRSNPGKRHYKDGCELMDCAPPLPRRAENEAWRLFGKIEQVNGFSMACLCSQAFKADYPDDEASSWVEAEDAYWENFGHYLAMGAMGHGASWFDDHEKFELKLPHTEVDFYDELEELNQETNEA